MLPVNQNKCVNPSYSYLKIVIACLAAASFSRVAFAQTNLFVGALKQGVVFEFSSSDDVIFTETTFTGLAGPETMVFDSSGNLFVSNGSAKTIKKITPSGVKTTFASDVDVDGMAFDAFGNLFVSQKSKDTDASEGVILEFAPDGSSRVFASKSRKPQGLAFDSLGNLYLAVSCSQRDFKDSLLMEGRQHSRPEFPNPIALRLTPLDFCGSRTLMQSALYAITPVRCRYSYRYAVTIDPELTGLNDLAFDEAGNLFLTAGKSVVEIDSTLTTLFTVASVPGGAGGIAIEPPLATNLSTRVSVQGGDGVAIAGFIISGSSPKQVLIRGLGAKLERFSHRECFAGSHA